MLQIKNLLKKYGDKVILNIDQLNVQEGIIHLKGINGSGKTTFSKIVAGLIPFDGEIMLHGRFSPTKTKVSYRKHVNYAESEPNYPEFLTANDLLTFFGKSKGSDNNEIQSKSKVFGLNEYMYDHIGTYSSGMLKRLSLTKAFLGSPSLILLDEPFNTLDVKAIEILKNEILSHREKGISFILVSHQNISKIGIPIDDHYLVENHTINEIK